MWIRSWQFPATEAYFQGPKMPSQKRKSTALGERQFINYYRCSIDGREWVDVWSCCCNDRCPTCRAEIEPYKSVEATHSYR
jgi:hypothetical protein